MLGLSHVLKIFITTLYPFATCMVSFSLNLPCYNINFSRNTICIVMHFSALRPQPPTGKFGKFVTDLSFILLSSPLTPDQVV